MSLISASFFVVSVDKGALDWGLCVVQIEAIDAGERMNLGAEGGYKLRSLLQEQEKKERRQVLLRTVRLPLPLNKADIADYSLKSSSRTPVIMKNTESVMGRDGTTLRVYVVDLSSPLFHQ